MNLSLIALNAVENSIVVRLGVALAVGGIIGLERSYHGRPAGFRTHALVCLSTSMLMLLTVYEEHWFPVVVQGRIALDPTRMVQGIMTGVGFIGAGTIMHSGLSVRGLTTAASIWCTAAIGVMIGVGFWFPALLATGLVLLTLSVFRWVEGKMPSQVFANIDIRFPVDLSMSEAHVRDLLGEHGLKISNLNYEMNRVVNYFEYRITVRTSNSVNVKRFCDALSRMPGILQFNLTPLGE